MFLIRKIVSPFLFPLPLTLLVSLVGLGLLWFTRRQRAGKVLVTIGLLALALLSHGLIAGRVLQPLEQSYPMFEMEAHRDWAAGSADGPRYVVVLGAGTKSDPRLPITSQLADSSVVRLVEGIRIHRQIPGSLLILSGGRVFDQTPEGEAMAQLAMDLGIASDDLIIENGSRDTEAQALMVKQVVGAGPFVLVTSASHMPRSMALFRRAGLEPIPAPTRHRVRIGTKVSPGLFFPSAEDLLMSERAFYEYLGIAWAKLCGRL